MDLLSREMKLVKLLVEEKSITAAAHRSGVQQPAISKMLIQMEQRLGRPLFARTSEGLKPHPFALELSKLAAQAQLSWDKSLSTILEKETMIEGHFKIGCHPILAVTYLSKKYSSLQSKYPLLNLELSFDSSRAVTQRVAAGDLQFGVVANPIQHHELVVCNLNQEGVYLYQHGPLKKESVIYFNPEMIDVTKYIRQLRNYKLVPLADYQVILAFVTAHSGQGAILPAFFAERNSKLQPVSKAFYSARIKLIYREDIYKSAAVRLIIDEIKDAAP